MLAWHLLVGCSYLYTQLHMRTHFPSCQKALAAHTNAEDPYVMAVWNKGVQENHAYSTYLVCLEHRQVENGCKGACERLQHSRPVAHVLLVLKGLVCSLKGAPSGAACQGCTLPQKLIPPLASLHQACTHSFIHSLIHLFIRSLARSFIHSFVRLFGHSFVCLFIRSFIHPSIHVSNQLLVCVCLFVHSFVCSFIYQRILPLVRCVHFWDSLYKVLFWPACITNEEHAQAT